MKKVLYVMFALIVVLALVLALKNRSGKLPSSTIDHFDQAATYEVSGSVAEIVTVTSDGRTLIYTDSESQVVGFVDISDPQSPQEIITIALDGEPTSVAAVPSGQWALVVVHGSPDHLVVVDLSDHTIATKISLSGQPDSIAINSNGRYAAIAIENERDEDLNDGEMPQSPAGSITLVDLTGPPSAWTTRDVALDGIAEKFPTDPEPEFVDINAVNQVAVTLQENNHIVIIDLETGKVISNWSAGTTMHAADIKNDEQVVFEDDALVNTRREPDAIAWTPGGNLVTANEGDYDLDLGQGEFVGGRDFTIFSSTGSVLFEPGASLEQQAEQEGLYDDKHSDAKGCEIEGVEIGTYSKVTFLFIGSERCGFVAVYLLNKDEARPEFVQLLVTGSRPEGLLAIPQRGLFVSANEGDGTISIFQGVPGAPK